ncbi:MAG: HAMP domain-containing histidine kinase [Lachnospiraceae bacterium]|nr:HAMP domain-containing histidine kinase [Lachnospiraceae bacterium]
MSKKSNIKITILFVLSAGLIVTAMTAYLLSIYYRQVCFHILVGFCESIIEKNPDSRQAVLELLKTQDFQITGEKILSNKYDNHVIPNFGYYPSNLGITDATALWIAILVFLAGSILFLFSFWYWHRKSDARIQALTKYLERINTGVQGLVFESSDDEFSKLQDEIYKTVTELYQTREEALTARNNFSENLSNIAHQLKTPITSISLTVQMAKEHLGGVQAAEIERQINRLLHLEEALLLLSRIDAGTLAFDRKPTDVFTILSLASDNLYELFVQKGVLIDVPEMGEMNINVDLNWTMEAVMNLMKNCMEATGIGSAVHCSYEKNPLYVQIQIWDEGKGFAKGDLPHLFERFYRGENAKNSGIGIGLSLSKAIIEMQNGIIRAFNLPNGGACFEIRFYTS